MKKKPRTGPIAIISCVVLASFPALAAATGWQTNLTLTTVTSSEYGGEIASFQVSQAYDNSGGCANPSGYVIRATSLRGQLAVLLAALAAGRAVDVYVTGACDAGGQPQVNGVTIHAQGA